MKIFIVQDDGSKDFSRLLAITPDVVVCTTRQYPLLSSQAEHVDEIRESLKSFDSAQDFVVLVGDPVNIGLALTFALQKGGPIKLLKWDRHVMNYVPIKLSLN